MHIKYKIQNNHRREENAISVFHCSGFVVISVAPESPRARFLISGSDSDVVQIHYWSTAKVENWHKPVCC